MPDDDLGEPWHEAQGSLEDVDPHSELAPLRLLSSLLAQTLSEGVSGHAVTPAEAGWRWAVEHVPARPGARPADTPGRWLGKLAQMVDVLQEWGYTPELRTSEGGRTAEITPAGIGGLWFLLRRDWRSRIRRTFSRASSDCRYVT